MVRSCSDTVLGDAGVRGRRLKEYILGPPLLACKSLRLGVEIGRADLDRFNITGETLGTHFILRDGFLVHSAHQSDKRNAGCFDEPRGIAS